MSLHDPSDGLNVTVSLLFIGVISSQALGFFLLDTYLIRQDQDQRNRTRKTVLCSAGVASWIALLQAGGIRDCKTVTKGSPPPLTQPT
jgi:hypothetical protein